MSMIMEYLWELLSNNLVTNDKINEHRFLSIVCTKQDCSLIKGKTYEQQEEKAMCR